MGKIEGFKYRIQQYKNRIGLKNRDFTIISNNCWSGFIYQKFNLQYKSPFIGVFLFTPDYIKLLKNFNSIIYSELKFIDFEESKYISHIKSGQDTTYYPIGILDENIEIHFLHYKDKHEAKEKWEKRVKRINFNNILFKLSERDLCSEELIKEFDKLPYRNKICFTANKYENIESAIYVKECNQLGYVEKEWIYCNKNIKRILNNLVIGDT